MNDAKPHCHRLPMTSIQQAIWLCSRFPFSDRDIQKFLHQRGIEVSQETWREWCIEFGPLLAKVCTALAGV
ncbi:hypothetical protein ACFFLM_00340 [Deinococcus oregonensis]|uniref:Transposase n=1 Tax=Deinococcus oregonensis TaxID=1805970 RepID=A0ABV6AW66_9DEIO